MSSAPYGQTGPAGPGFGYPSAAPATTQDFFSAPSVPATQPAYGYPLTAQPQASYQPAIQSQQAHTLQGPGAGSFGGFQQSAHQQGTVTQNQDFGDFESAKPVVVAQKPADPWGTLVNLSDLKPKSEVQPGTSRANQAPDHSSSFHGLDGFSKPQQNSLTDIKFLLTVL